jgi:hypothetical protein
MMMYLQRILLIVMTTTLVSLVLIGNNILISNSYGQNNNNTNTTTTTEQEEPCIAGDTWNAHGPGKTKTFVGFLECNGVKYIRDKAVKICDGSEVDICIT